MKVSTLAVFLKRDRRAAPFNHATACRHKQGLNELPLKISVDRVGEDCFQRFALRAVHDLIIGVIAHFAIVAAENTNLFPRPLRERVRVRGLVKRRSPFAISALLPRGSHFLLRRQKKVTKKEAAPTFAPCVTIARFAAKTSRGPKLASAQTTGRVIDVFAANLGVEYTGTPSDQYFIASRWAYANPRMIICATG